MEDKDTLEGKRYLRAKNNIEKIKEVYIHIAVFVFIMPIVIITNVMFVPSIHYFWFALFGWGLGVFLHWLTVIGFKSSLFGEDWEKRKIKEAMDKEEKHWN